MPKLPTIQDVANLARVSRQTVSNVLNTPEIVRPQTRERVLHAVDTLGYRVHASARRLRTQKSSTLGVRLDPETDGISGAILDRFLHALTEQADAVGLRTLLFTARDVDDEIRQFQKLMLGRDVDAFILTSTFRGDPRTEWLVEHAQPFVTFGRPWGLSDQNDTNHAWVDVDGRAGTYLATTSLLRRGKNHIGFIGWPNGSDTGDDRASGWEAALATIKTPLEIASLREQCADTVDEGRRAFIRLRERVPDLDAVVSASDSLALAVALQSHGTMPVIGFDNTPVSAAMGFSSIDQRPAEIAKHTLSLLRTPASDSPRNHLVRPTLVTRG